jgi:hypothetical protein
VYVGDGDMKNLTASASVSSRKTRRMQDTRVVQRLSRCDRTLDYNTNGSSMRTKTKIKPPLPIYLSHILLIPLSHPKP